MKCLNQAASAIRVESKGQCIMAQAPANIALIKYMGKRDNQINQAINPSVSWTLMNHCVRVTLTPSTQWSWAPLTTWGTPPFLSEQEQARFLKHARDLTAHWQSTQAFHVQSSTNFPANCGLASSAASFAALTAAISHAMVIWEGVSNQATLADLAALSQRGSGSSCRSFFKGWVLWDESVKSLQLNWPECLHQVLIVSDQPKKVLSSEAHQRIQSSALFPGRAKRATARYQSLLTALNTLEWHTAYQIVWQEFWDMHALFHTSNPAFQYMTAQTMEVLLSLQQYWVEHQDGPLITLDAGANVHCIYRNDQRGCMQDIAAQLPTYIQVI